jgi:microcystin-dependent protein
MPAPSAFGQNADPYSGAKLYIYEAGTVTPKTIYSDPVEVTPRANPVVADVKGRFAAFYVTGKYKAKLVQVTLSGEVTIWEYDDQQAAESALTGSIIFLATDVIPAGYLECNGGNLSRTLYKDLFDIIGTRYGSVDSGTFTLPDLRGRFLRGWDHGAGNDPDAAGRSSSATGGVSGDEVGSAQLDAFQGVKMRTIVDFGGAEKYLADNTTVVAGTDQVGGVVVDAVYPDKDRDSNAFFASEYVTDGTNGTPRPSSESRPRNINGMFVIKT